MSWTAGYLIASARDVAKFYWDLLGPDNKILSPESLALQTNFTVLDEGWSKDYLLYGGGLMIENSDYRKEKAPKATDLTSYIGHGGDTYGFLSDQGFFPQLNVSMSIITNQDVDSNYPQ
jgi:CubicO group peptidase (beta-lactamase class C family)